MSIESWAWQYSSEIMTATNSILTLFVFVYYKYFNASDKKIGYYVILALVFELIATVSAKLVENNLPGLHLYTILEFIILTFFFNEAFKLLKCKFRLKPILLLGSILIVINSLFIQSIFIYNSHSKSFVELYIIVCCIYIFYLILTNKEVNYFKIRSTVYFTNALLLKSSVSIIIYLYNNELIKLSESQYIQLMTIKNVTLFISHIIIGVGLVYIISKNRLSIIRM